MTGALTLIAGLLFGPPPAEPPPEGWWIITRGGTAKGTRPGAALRFTGEEMHIVSPEGEAERRTCPLTAKGRDFWRGVPTCPLRVRRMPDGTLGIGEVPRPAGAEGPAPPSIATRAATPEEARALDERLAARPAPAEMCARTRACCHEAAPLLGAPCDEEALGLTGSTTYCEQVQGRLRQRLEQQGRPPPASCQ